MKFAKVLHQNSIAEWESQYISYKRLKKLIKKVRALKDKQAQATGEEGMRLR